MEEKTKAELVLRIREEIKENLPEFVADITLEVLGGDKRPSHPVLLVVSACTFEELAHACCFAVGSLVAEKELDLDEHLENLTRKMYDGFTTGYEIEKRKISKDM